MNNQQKREGSPWQIAAHRFTTSSLSLGSLLFLLFVTIFAIFAYAIAPDSTPNANTQHLELATKHPGFKATFFLAPNYHTGENENLISRLISGKSKNHKEIPISAHRYEGWNIVVTEYYDYYDTVRIEQRFSIAEILIFNSDTIIKLSDDSAYFAKGNKAISLAELREKVEQENFIQRRFSLGTDRFGRDMLSRLIIGSRVSLSVGFIAVAISLFIGVFFGATAGYFRGFYDDLVMWFVNVVWSIPTLLMVIALTMVLGKGFWQIFVAVGLTMWVEVARVVRGQVLSLREKEFVEAAKVMGFGTGRIIFRHILPNILGPVIIISASNFATAILLEAGLSFLGIGVQPPVPSWGTMIKDHYGFIIMDKAYLAILPGVAIMLLVLAFTLIGNGLRDALDPKSEGY
jgi:ABC-type dipeptide/oligopeptide/nickel transport system permease subunit